MLGEFNLANSNMPATQGVFADASGSNQIVRQLWHNNLVLVNAYHGIAIKDPSGTGEMRVYRNHVMRAAPPPPDGVDNTSARIMFFKATNGQNPTTAVYDIRENYCNSVAIGTELAANTTSEDNIIVAVNPGVPNYIGNMFAGNGTFGVNGVGRGNYADPGKGLSKSAAKTAMRNFFQPIGGYRVAGACMTDPATWPAAGAPW